MAFAYNLSAGETGISGFLGLSDRTSGSSERPYLKKTRRTELEERQPRLISGLHIHMHTHAYTEHTYAYINRYAKIK